ncbi:DUF1761 domain-containing protein [Mucilaginibacter myungsuensis]|uniref:DUF1761 domain-containing protein n=1 Tax=Mucilaginibacter myungsuensis TaxID=649104 RepID=A0A929KY49_9SPHI|nr:DUF1761 domain-containing protein [Mucilaginibacter myungsuensis]MBE9662665.1 DUF1761 domain-containing protein [Mucilaginibacter myungsuensis]MDN3598085.1 DUF1761 domain-containing protein [Mucilaginibacter myungsuensis]
MLQFLTNLNWVSVLIAFAVYFVLGGLWFTLIFAKPYKASLGRDGETLPNKPIFIVGPAICSLVITVTNALLINALNIDTVGGAIEFALIIGIGYLVANTVNIAINPNIPRPIFYSVISGAYHLVSILIASVILVLMK